MFSSIDVFILSFKGQKLEFMCAVPSVFLRAVGILLLGEQRTRCFLVEYREAFLARWRMCLKIAQELHF